MAKVLCVLYDDPVTGYPTGYARDGDPEHRPLPRRPDGTQPRGPSGTCGVLVEMVPHQCTGQQAVDHSRKRHRITQPKAASGRPRCAGLGRRSSWRAMPS